MSEIRSQTTAARAPIGVLSRWALNVIYLTAITLASPLIAYKSWRTGKYREGFGEKLMGRLRTRKGTRYCVWLHAVSVGEVNLIDVLIEELRRRHPKWEFCVTTSTKAGYELARKKYRRDYAVFYCPLDFTWAVKRAVRRVRPDLLLLAELELWPNLIAEVKKQGGKVAVINGRLSENSFKGYRRLGPIVQKTLASVDLVAAQDQATAERFAAIGARPEVVQVSGSLKYDGASTTRNNPMTNHFRELCGWKRDETIFLAGSTQEPEEEIALQVFEELTEDHPELRLILVPRHPERFEDIAKLLDSTGVAWNRRTELESAIGTDEDAKILLVDSVGELGSWWGLADIGFVGGSFGDRGGQNMIEPAAYGVATSFGPNTKNFRDIVSALLEADGARVVQTPDDLQAFVTACLRMPNEAKQLGLRGQALVESQLGATYRTADLVEAVSEYIPYEVRVEETEKKYLLKAA